MLLSFGAFCDKKQHKNKATTNQSKPNQKPHKNPQTENNPPPKNTQKNPHPPKKPQRPNTSIQFTTKNVVGKSNEGDSASFLLELCKPEDFFFPGSKNCKSPLICIVRPACSPPAPAV